MVWLSAIRPSSVCGEEYDISASANVCSMLRSKSGLAWASCSAIQPSSRLLGGAVIVILLVKDLWKDFKQDHARAVSHHDATPKETNAHTISLDVTDGGVPYAGPGCESLTRMSRITGPISGR
jgi:hypothetical protein